MEGVLLVNGNPSPIDVDDDRFTMDAEMRKNAAYAALAEQYPHISLWPGDRFDSKLPTMTSTGWGTQIIFGAVHVARRLPRLRRTGDCYAGV